MWQNSSRVYKSMKNIHIWIYTVLSENFLSRYCQRVPRQHRLQAEMIVIIIIPFFLKSVWSILVLAVLCLLPYLICLAIFPGFKESDIWKTKQKTFHLTVIYLTSFILKNICIFNSTVLLISNMTVIHGRGNLHNNIIK